MHADPAADLSASSIIRRATMRVPGSHDVERRVSAEMGSKQRLPHSQISLRISGRILGERPPA
jgi:hypothetical protein